jgi:hypothetical protein
MITAPSPNAMSEISGTVEPWDELIPFDTDTHTEPPSSPCTLSEVSEGTSMHDDTEDRSPSPLPVSVLPEVRTFPSAPKKSVATTARLRKGKNLNAAGGRKRTRARAVQLLDQPSPKAAGAWCDHNRSERCKDVTYVRRSRLAEMRRRLAQKIASDPLWRSTLTEQPKVSEIGMDLE